MEWAIIEAILVVPSICKGMPLMFNVIFSRMRDAADIHDSSGGHLGYLTNGEVLLQRSSFTTSNTRYNK